MMYMLPLIINISKLFPLHFLHFPQIINNIYINIVDIV